MKLNTLFFMAKYVKDRVSCHREFVCSRSAAQDARRASRFIRSANETCDRGCCAHNRSRPRDHWQLCHSLRGSGRFLTAARLYDLKVCAYSVVHQAFDKLCKGRGGSIPLSCNVMDWRSGDVCFYAPLLEMERKELAIFTEFTNLNTYECRELWFRSPVFGHFVCFALLVSVWFPTFTTAAGKNTSISAAVEQFLAGLQVLDLWFVLRDSCRTIVLTGVV
jgi:hypothetical protein